MINSDELQKPRTETALSSINAIEDVLNLLNVVAMDIAWQKLAVAMEIVILTHTLKYVTLDQFPAVNCNQK